jgi:predicted transcriptional regulator
MAPRAVFPLRWRNEKLRTLTAEVAARLGISQNELIEQAIEHEVVARGGMLSDDLRAAADRLAELTQEHYERIQARGLEQFVAGEALSEPLQTRSLQPAVAVDRVAVERSDLPRDIATIYRSARTGLA